MRTRLFSTSAALTLVLASAACNSAGSASLDSDDQKASYSLGQDLGRNLASSASRIDLDALVAGFADAMAEAEPKLTLEEQQQALMAFGQSVQEARAAEAEALAETNRAEGEAYLTENGARDGVITTESGLQYEVLAEGEGPNPGPQDRVTIHYTGTLIDGTEFDSSRGGDPATFGVSGVIAGFGEALQLMSPGSRFRVVIPGDLGYGPQGAGGSIGPNATLIFDIEMLEIASDN